MWPGRRIRKWPQSFCVSSGSREQEDLCSSGVTVQNLDFTSALEVLQNAQSKAVGAPKVTQLHRTRTRQDFLVTASQIVSAPKDPERALGGYRRPAAREEGDLGHGSASAAASGASVFGPEPDRGPAVRTARDREDPAGQSCGHRVLHDLPQVHHNLHQSVVQLQRL